MKRNRAFTLAEALITLMVIGVVAALTIPALMQSHKDRQTVTAVLKAASTLTNAFKLTVIDNGEPMEWFIDDNSAGILKFYNHLSTSKICEGTSECFFSGNFRPLNYPENEDWWGLSTSYSAILSDGSTIAFMGVGEKDCTNNDAHDPKGNPINCGRIYYDINGLKEPNTIGKDIFTFALTKNGVAPDRLEGAAVSGEYTQEEIMGEAGCDLTSNWIHNGKACTAYILEHRNVDYLHK